MKTISFYSYKGGVGRSLALTYIANYLADRNIRVCVLDIDLEAPGVAYKFLNKSKDIFSKPGVVDYVHSCFIDNSVPGNIEAYLSTVPSEESKYGYVKVMNAGKDINTGKYWKKLSEIDWNKLFMEECEGLYIFENLKQQIEKQIDPDYLLIDSRSGITTMGKVCCSILPDKVVMLHANNQENYLGSKLMYDHISNSVEYKVNRKPSDIICVITRFPAKEDESDIFRKYATFYETKEKEIKEEFVNRINNPSLKYNNISIIHSDRKIEFDELSILKKKQPRTRQIVEDYGKLLLEIIFDDEDKKLYETRNALVSNKPKYRFLEYDLNEIIEKELEAIREDASYNKNSGYLLYKRALCERHAGETVKSALTLYDAINSEDNEDNEDNEWKICAYYLRGMMFLYDFNNYEKSITDLELVYETNASFKARIGYDLAVCYYCLDKYDKAKEHIEHYLSENENDPKAFLLKAVINRDNLDNKKMLNIDTGEKEKILSDFEKAITLYPHEYSYNSKGVFHYRLGEYDQASDDFGKAININPHFEIPYVNRGWCYFKLNEKEKARDDFNKAIEINHDYEIAYNARGWYYFNENEKGKARDDFNKAIEINPHYETALINREKLYIKMGLTDNISDSYNNVLETNLLNDRYYNKKLLKSLSFPVKYPIDGSNLEFYFIKDDDKFFLSDRGKTMKMLNEHYDLKNRNVSKNIVAALKEFKVRKNRNDLTIEIKDGNTDEAKNKELSEAKYRLFRCFSFLKNMHLFDENWEKSDTYFFTLLDEIKSEKNYKKNEKYPLETRYCIDYDKYEFALIRKKDKVYISDQGKTYKVLANVFELKENDVQKNLNAIMNVCRVLQDEDEFIIEIEKWNGNTDPEKNTELNEAIYRLLECVSFMETMRIFYV